MGERKNPCYHMHLDPETKKCADCEAQIYPAPAPAPAPEHVDLDSDMDMDMDMERRE